MIKFNEGNFIVKPYNETSFRVQYTIYDKTTKKEVGRLSATLEDNGKTLGIIIVQMDSGAGALGHKNLRDIMQQVLKRNPNVKRVYGQHVGGTGKQNPKMMNYQASDIMKEQPMIKLKDILEFMIEDAADEMPTPSSEWVLKGDRAYQPKSGWKGTVLKVIKTTSLPYAIIKWDNNGHVGRMTITMLRKLNEIQQTADNWRGNNCANYDDSQDVCLDKEDINTQLTQSEKEPESTEPDPDEVDFKLDPKIKAIYKSNRAAMKPFLPKNWRKPSGATSMPDAS